MSVSEGNSLVKKKFSDFNFPLKQVFTMDEYKTLRWNDRKDLKLFCEAFYMSGRSLNDIHLATNIELHLLELWCWGSGKNGLTVGCWELLKRKGEGSVINAFIEMKTEAIKHTAGNALTLLADGLDTMKQEVADKKKTLSIKDMKSLSEIVANLDKLVRLDEGKATEIIQRVGLSVEEAKNILKSDPFAFGIIDISEDPERKDYEEI